MPNQNNRYWIFFLILIIAMLWFKYDRLKDENRQLTDTIEDYKNALNGANENIESANSYIEDAQYSAWETYEDMDTHLKI